MRVTVIRAFVDKETGQGYNIGEDYENADVMRVTDLYEAGFLSKPSELKSVAKRKTTRTRKAAAK